MLRGPAFSNGRSRRRLPPQPANPGSASHPSHFNTHAYAPPTPQRSTAPAGYSPYSTPSSGASSASRATVRPDVHTRGSSTPDILSEVLGLFSPSSSPLSVQELAEVAHTLGVRPKQSEQSSSGPNVSDIGKTVTSAVRGFEKLTHDAGQAVRDAAGAANTQRRPKTFMGRKTLGEPTLERILKGAQNGVTRVNKKGAITLPAERRATRRVNRAAAYYRKTARPNTSGLSPQEKAILPYVLRAHKEYPDIPVSVMMAQIKQESGFDPNARNAESGAFGATQFIPSTAASYGVMPGASPQAIQSQVSGQAHLLHDDSFATDPQGALSAYSGGYAASDYNNPILADARANYGALDRPAVATEKAKRQLAAALEVAQKLGIKAKPTAQEAAPPAPQKPAWLLAGGPKNVKHAIQVVGKQPLAKWLKPNGGNTGNWRNIADLNPVLARQLVALAKATGEPIVVTSGYRSKQEQAEIDPGTNPAAPPGLSAHQFGMAADVEMSARQAALAPKFGLEHGQAGPGVEDPPHTELTDPKLIREAMKYGPIRSGYAPSGWQSEGDLGSYTAPANLSEGGGSYGGGSYGGAGAGSVGGGSAVGGGAGGSVPRPQVTSRLTSLSPLLAVAAAFPQAFQQFQGGLAPEEEGEGEGGGIIDEILKRRSRA